MSLDEREFRKVAIESISERYGKEKFSEIIVKALVIHPALNAGSSVTVKLKHPYELSESVKEIRRRAYLEAIAVLEEVVRGMKSMNFDEFEKMNEEKLDNEISYQFDDLK